MRRRQPADSAALHQLGRARLHLEPGRADPGRAGSGCLSPGAEHGRPAECRPSAGARARKKLCYPGASSAGAGVAQLIPERSSYPFPTLPDLLTDGLQLVFVGINPSVYSVERGHYFARSTSRFWPAFSRSRLSEPIRAALSRETLGPADDTSLLRFGIGFTDVVKQPSNNAAALKPADYQLWAPRLLERLERYRPGLACFHGVTGYRAFLRYGLGEPRPLAELGPQERQLGPTRVYVVPNPSPANAHVRPEDQVAWYDRLAEYLGAPDPHGLQRL